MNDIWYYIILLLEEEREKNGKFKMRNFQTENSQESLTPMSNAMPDQEDRQIPHGHAHSSPLSTFKY